MKPDTAPLSGRPKACAHEWPPASRNWHGWQPVACGQIMAGRKPVTTALALAELSVGTGDGRALGPVDANGRRVGQPHPAEGCPVTAAAADRGATAFAASLADERGGLAGGRG